MKRFLRLAVPVFLLCVALPAQAETIKDFAVTGTLTTDRMLTLTEAIEYDFGSENRHGIYRILPDRYERNGAKYRLRFSFLEFSMDGLHVASQTTNEGGNKKVRLGDADIYVTGSHLYKIRYQTNRAINVFEDHEELYWNVNGTGWLVEANRVSFTLAAPTTSTKLACFTGTFGSTESACTIKEAAGKITAKTTRPLQAGEGLTVVAAFPRGTFTPIPWYVQVQQYFADNIPLLFPVLVFFVMFSLWSWRGREPRGRGVVIAHYEEPSGLTPLQFMGLRNQHVPLEAVTGEIFDLARRGYLAIEFIDDKNFKLIRKREADDKLTGSSKEILEGVFDVADEVTLADLKHKFWKPMEAAREKAFDELKAMKLFGMNPAVVRAGWIIGAIMGGVVVIPMTQFFGEAFVIAALASIAIVFFFGWFMPRKTPKGAVVLEEVEGFKKFLSVTETERLKFFDAPAKTPEQFSRFLPAAIAFGVESQWAKQFEGVMIQPEYVQGQMQMNAMTFAHVGSAFNTASAASAYSAPSSAGRGSSGFSSGGSGGGFGGGGGGSW